MVKSKYGMMHIFFSRTQQRGWKLFLVRAIRKKLCLQANALILYKMGVKEIPCV